MAGNHPAFCSQTLWTVDSGHVGLGVSCLGSPAMEYKQPPAGFSLLLVLVVGARGTVILPCVSTTGKVEGPPPPFPNLAPLAIKLTLPSDPPGASVPTVQQVRMDPLPDPRSPVSL